MYIRGDIFIDPSYPLYFGIGNRRFNERVKTVGEEIFIKKDEISEYAVTNISINNNIIEKDESGTINFNCATIETDGLMSASDKEKLDSINLEWIEHN